MKVRKESRKLVTPSLPTPKTKLKLSFLDHIQPSTYVGIIFHYKNNSNGPDIHERLVKLEKSLSETLVLFYPFAGRYLEEGGYSFIDCGDQGVEYVSAKVDGDIDLLLDKEIDPDMLMNLSSFPEEFENGNSLIVIQVNLFKCGGLAIGVRFNHKLTDTCSLSMFMSAWSMACCDGITHVIPPSFDFGSLIPQKEIGESDVRTTDQTRSSPSDLISKKLVSKNFTFHYDVISKLKAEIMKDSNELNPESTSLQASRVEVISAVISKMVIEIKSAKHGVNLKPFAIGHTMNLRGKTNLGVPDYSCGNFFTRIVTPPWNAEETGIMTLPVLEKICDAIRTAKQQFSMATEVDLCSLVEEKHEESTEARRKTMDGEFNLIAFSSWCKFPFYKVKFGWGEPAFVITTPAPFEIIVLIDSKLKDGIEAWVTLDIDDMLLLKPKLDTILRVVQS